MGMSVHSALPFFFFFFERAEAPRRFTCALQFLCCGNGSFFQPLGERLQAPRSWEHRPHPALALHRLSELSVHIRQPVKTHARTHKEGFRF